MGSVFMTGLALALALNAATVWFFLPELSFADLKKLGGAAVLDPKTAGLGSVLVLPLCPLAWRWFTFSATPVWWDDLLVPQHRPRPAC